MCICRYMIYDSLLPRAVVMSTGRRPAINSSTEDILWSSKTILLNSTAVNNTPGKTVLTVCFKNFNLNLLTIRAVQQSCLTCHDFTLSTATAVSAKPIQSVFHIVPIGRRIILRTFTISAPVLAAIIVFKKILFPSFKLNIVILIANTGSIYNVLIECVLCNIINNFICVFLMIPINIKISICFRSN